MAGIRIEGDTSGNVGEINTAKEFKTTGGSATRADAGYSVALFEQDAGTVNPAGKTRRSPWVSQDRRLAVGVDTALLNDNFNATAQNTGLWRYIFATMTSTQSGGSMLMNSGSTLTTTTGCQLTSWRQIPILGSAGLRIEAVMAFTASPLANQVVEFGLFPFGTGTATPTEGVYFRYTSAGLVGIINYNGVETPTPVMLTAGGANFTDSKMYSFKIRVDNLGGVDFIRDEVILGNLLSAAANGMPSMQCALPLSFQFRNSGTVSGAPVMQCKVASTNVIQRDIHTTKPWAHQMTVQGLGFQTQNGSAVAHGGLPIYVNNQATAAAALLNTSAAAAFTGLGGQFAVLPTLTTNTDGILCSYQNPVGGINQTPRTLVITGVSIKGIVPVIFAGGPVLYAYALCYGHTAVSLAVVADSTSFVTATVKQARRIPLGVESYPVTAPVGTIGQGVQVKFDSPVVVNPGEFIAISAKNMGTVTTTGQINILVTFDGYME